MMAHYNGRLQKESDIFLHPANRAFRYGDGLFETMVVEGSEIRYWGDHVERISRGCEALHLHLPHRSWQQDIIELCSTVEHMRKRVKWQVWRKEGGIVTPTSKEVDWLITVQEFFPAPLVKKHAVFFNGISLAANMYSRYKTLQFLPYIQAGIFRADKNADEVVLFGPNECIAEAGIGNIFWIKQGKVFTPSLDAGCIDGIMRKQILRYLSEKNIQVEEGVFYQKDLTQVEAVFTSNVSGISIVEQLEHSRYDTNHTLVLKLQNQFNYF